jgi:hypothetical protein
MRRQQIVRVVVRLACVVGASAVIWGVIGPTYNCLIPWWLYGDEAATQSIRVLSSNGRSVVLSNGHTVNEAEFRGLIFFMGFAVILTVALFFNIARFINRCFASRSETQI